MMDKYSQVSGTTKVKSILLLTFALIISCSTQLSAQSEYELKQHIALLKRELTATKTELKQIKEKYEPATDMIQKNNVVQDVTLNEPVPKKFQLNDLLGGNLKIGGATRVNYVLGDYGGNTGGPSRDFSDGGNFLLDTFRFNLDYENGPYVGKMEYRFYDGYHMLHTGWLGYNFENGSQLQLGVNRAPFGPGNYGVSQSWFFDQHYYVGLSDDMDLGIKYLCSFGKLDLDFAFYYTDESSFEGQSIDSARFSYDIVNETEDGYEERNQFNFRGIYNFEGNINTALGVSLQYGQLNSKGPQNDGDHFASSIHMVNKWNSWTIASQLTYYEYDIDKHDVTSGVLGTDKLIDMGAYDFAWPIATEAWIPAVSLSYHFETTEIAWLDYVIPYIEYSSILKSENGFNSSNLFTLGMAWARGGWYIYTDFCVSDGNYFVGSDGDDYGSNKVGDFGTNGNDESNNRFNINFGYYF